MKNKIVGYTCGSFDLFHIGHLNILKKAKKQCDYLIVGINSDETMLRCKGKLPIIPYTEREQIIKSIKYVDKVIKVEVPAKCAKGNDWQIRLESDVLFSGDDHKNEPDWDELKRLKKNNNTRLVFFSYTKTTSSTLIRKVLEDKVNDG